MPCALTVPVRFQVEEVLLLPEQGQIYRPHPGDGVDGTLPNTLRKFLTIFFGELEIDRNSL